MVLFPKKCMTLLVLGLDGAGKSTLLYRLQSNFSSAPKAGWGFSTATIRFSLTWMWACIPVPVFRWVTMYDVGGGPKIRGIWSKYLAEVHGCVFVIDASDQARIPEAVEALHDIYSNERLKGKPLLVLANKSDISTSVSEKYFPAHLRLEELFPSEEPDPSTEGADGSSSQVNSKKRFYIKSISLGCGYHIDEVKAKYTGEALQNAMKWIIEEVEDMRLDLDARIKSDLEKDKAVTHKEASMVHSPKLTKKSSLRRGQVAPVSD